MSLNKNDFNRAFREVIALEFKDIPTDESQINYTFSTSFEKKMNKLIAAEKRKIWTLVNTIPKRIALIAVIAALLFTTACSVSAIREPIVNFFVELHDTFVHYVFEGDKSDTIATEYHPTELPNGFTQTNRNSSPSAIDTVYENSSGDVLVISQTITNGVDMFADTEKSELKTITISGNEVHLHSRAELMQARWIQDTYLMTITYYGKVNEAQIIKIIGSIKPNQ